MNNASSPDEDEAIVSIEGVFGHIGLKTTLQSVVYHEFLLRSGEMKMEGYFPFMIRAVVGC